MRNLLRKLSQDEDGASMVEYAVLLALITGASIAAITALGGSVSGFFTAITASLTAATP